MKKKLISILLILALILSCLGLTACGGSGDSYNAQTTVTSEASGSGSDKAASDSSNAADVAVSDSSDETSSDTIDTSDVDSGDNSGQTNESSAAENPAPQIDEDGWYSSKEDVALYIYTYGKLPGNFITKKEAEKLGWSGGSLEPYAPGKSIGGSHFGNYEGLLPQGHEYTECDIDTAGAKSRGAKRIVFSDVAIYYTEDHYESFELLYGEE